MKWRVLIAGAVVGALGWAAYACTSDTFDGGAPATQAEFCDAEATYYSYCHIDAACVATNLNNCGSLYSYLSAPFATAIAHCAEKDQIDCNATYGSMITTPCVQNELADASNTSSALANLAADFCKACGATQSCVQKFASTTDQPGYLASLFSDPIVNQIDNTCIPKNDAGFNDGGLTCAQQFALCEYVVLGFTLPKGACQEGGL